VAHGGRRRRRAADPRGPAVETEVEEMPRAIWNGKVVAESERFETVERNVYFPPDSLRREYFRDSDTTTECPWKGTAHYYTLVVEGAETRDAAWFYPDPKPAARDIKDHVAFGKGVTVEA
jgi:uncharacterized protein (DUF427 family)